MRLIRLMPYTAIGITTSALTRCAAHSGIPVSSVSAVDMMLASIANSRKVNDA